MHSNDLKKAPLINSALGISIRGAGLTRPLGGAKGFWGGVSKRYEELGGEWFMKTYVRSVEKSVDNGFHIHTNKGDFVARYVVSSLPAANTVKLFSKKVRID